MRKAAAGSRSGHYNRNLTATSGDVTLKVPKLKGISFETAIIERYRCRESSVEKALIEMYLAGVSVRRVEDITEALWGSKVSPSTISELNKKAYVHIEDWRNCSLHGGLYPYVYVDGIYLCVTGAENLKTWLFWWQLRLKKTDTERFLALPGA
jgi:putative transposase